MNGRIVVAGSLNMDMVINVQDMPKRGETIFGSSLEYIPGGKGANQACAAARLGGRTVMVGKVGADGMGETLRANLAKSGVDVDNVIVDEKEPTGLAVIYVDSRGGNSIVVASGANMACGEDFVLDRLDIGRGDILLLQMEIPHDTVYAAAKAAHAKGATVILNPAPAPGEAIPDDALAALDYFTPNETELAKISGMPVGSTDEAIAAARHLIDNKGVGTVLATLGEQGALLVTGSGAKLIPAITVKAVDTTAAGDTFCGAFSVALAEGMEEEEAIRFANRAAAISVTRKGAQTSIPTRAEVDARKFI